MDGSSDSFEVYEKTNDSNFPYWPLIWIMGGILILILWRYIWVESEDSQYSYQAVISCSIVQYQNLSLHKMKVIFTWTQYKS